MRVLYPYKTLLGDVMLTVTDASIDGRPVPVEHVDADRRIVSITAVERQKWEDASLRIEVTAPQTEIKEMIGTGAPARVVAVLQGGGTNTRKAIELRADETNAARFTGKLDLERPYWWGRLVLDSFVVATVDDVPGRVIGSAEPWVVSLDDVPRPPVTGNIPIVWVDFRTSQALAELRRVAEEPCYLDLNPDEPVLYLNESFPGLRQLFDERIRREADVQALHDQTRVTFAVQAWTAMFNAALAAAADTLDTEDGDEPDWPDAVWQKNVLEILLNRMYPESSPIDALRESIQLLHQGEGLAPLQERLLVSVSGQVGAARLLRASIGRLGELAEQETP